MHWGRILRVVACLQDIQERDVCVSFVCSIRKRLLMISQREMPVFGILDGQLVHGVAVSSSSRL